MSEDYEIWLDPMGRPAKLICLGHPKPVVDEDGYSEDWFPEQPGQRPPVEYRIEAVHNARLALREVVFPVEPWSPYDAISDRLVANGFTPPPPTEAEMAQCEHGLSAQLCSGPNHY